MGKEEFLHRSGEEGWKFGYERVGKKKKLFARKFMANQACWTAGRLGGEGKESAMKGGIQLPRYVREEGACTNKEMSLEELGARGLRTKDRRE